MTAPAVLSPTWALSIFGVSEDDFWEEGGDRLVDCFEIVKVAAESHARADFDLLWERCDPRHDVMAIVGRMVSTTWLEKAPDHPLDRSWFHALFMDLARIEGALDLDLSSERMLRHAVACYWATVKIFVSGAKEQIELVAAELGEGDKDLESEAAESISRQLSLF